MPFAWEPGEDVRLRAQLARFMKLSGHQSFEELYRWSVADIAGFTTRVLDFLGIEFDQPYSSIVDLSGGPAWARWCVDGKMNLSKSCVDRHVRSGAGERPAIVWEGEEGCERSVTYSGLLAEMEACAAGLRSLGIAKGDAVAVQLPMMPETVVALLALARIGAVAAPLFTGYGPSAIASRINDIQAKAIITADAYLRNGKLVNLKQSVQEALAHCPSVEHTIVVPRVGLSTEGRELSWSQLLDLGGDGAAEPTSAEDLLIVLYTSGTTGRPKGIAHSHCGFPIKSAQDMCFGADVGPGTRISWVTDIGWMMGPWLIYGATILGATLVLYDGAPAYPEPTRLWEFSAKHGVEVLGVSPTLIRTLAATDSAPVEPLPSLRILASTGEPWNPDPWWWLFNRVGQGRVPIVNYSGGTEISGGILMGNPLLPVKSCGFPAPCPGMDAAVFDENGRSVLEAVGELVIRQPWIGMARGFLHDPERYLATYWSRWPDVWVHGDWAMVDGDGHWFILGRSDDTLKVAGKRVGPAEIEAVLVAHPAVVEAAVIGIPDEVKGTAMLAFCVLLPNQGPSPELVAELRNSVGSAIGKPLRPERILFIDALPRTRNAKVMRRVLRAGYLGEDPGDLTALENPAVMESIRALTREVGSA